MIVEAVEVVLAGLLVARPGGLLHRREHGSLRVIARALVRPHVPVAVGRLRIGARRLEPGVIDRGVVRNQVDHHAKPERLRGVHALDEVARGAEARRNAVVVGDVVAVVAVGGAAEGLQPDAGHAERGQVIEPPRQAFEVADAVAIAVHVGGDVEAVDDRVLEPVVVDRHAQPDQLVRRRIRPSSGRSSSVSPTRSSARSRWLERTIAPPRASCTRRGRPPRFSATRKLSPRK